MRQRSDVCIDIDECNLHIFPSHGKKRVPTDPCFGWLIYLICVLQMQPSSTLLSPHSMARCEHISWISGSNPGLSPTGAVHDEGRLARLVAALPDADTQQPSLVLFVGRETKDRAVRQLFPHCFSHRDRKNICSQSMVNLRIDTSTSDHPLLLADANPRQSAATDTINPCHETKTYTVDRPIGNNISLFDLVHARVFCGLSDVICIFADDFASLDEVVEKLRSWAANIWRQGMMPASIVIVFTVDYTNPTYHILQQMDLDFDLNEPLLLDSFSGVRTFPISKGRNSRLVRCCGLKEALLYEVRKVRQLRCKSMCLFSARHLSLFMQDIIKHAVMDERAPDLIDLAFGTQGQRNGYEQHIERYLQLTSDGAPSIGVMRYLASALRMDAYPEGCHRPLIRTFAE